jgi:glycine betaine/proline transport system permease protein
MAALFMVIIAAVIGGFDHIGWAVLLTLRKADFGNRLVARLVIVIFAILINRLSCTLAEERQRRSACVALGQVRLGQGALLAGGQLPAASGINFLAQVADARMRP